MIGPCRTIAIASSPSIQGSASMARILAWSTGMGIDEYAVGAKVRSVRPRSTAMPSSRRTAMSAMPSSERSPTAGSAESTGSDVVCSMLPAPPK